jgi:hypothetical protein
MGEDGRGKRIPSGKYDYFRLAPAMERSFGDLVGTDGNRPAPTRPVGAIFNVRDLLSGYGQRVRDKKPGPCPWRDFSGAWSVIKEFEFRQGQGVGVSVGMPPAVPGGVSVGEYPDPDEPVPEVPAPAAGVPVPASGVSAGAAPGLLRAVCGLAQ